MTAGTVVLTASAGTFPGLVQALRDIPVVVEERPLMNFSPPLDWAPVDGALDRLAGYGAIAFTSPRAARAITDRAAARGIPWGHSKAEVWAAGPATAEALPNMPSPVRVPGERYGRKVGAAGVLARAMLAARVSGPVLFPCGDLRRDELPAELRKNGIDVDEVVCYRSVLAGESEARAAAACGTVLVVASPSVANLLARACPPPTRPELLAVGPTTAASARAAGWTPAAVASEPNVPALASAITSLLGQR